MKRPFGNRSFATSPAAPETALQPQFAFRPGATVVMNGEACQIERRLGGRWQLISVETSELRFLTDAEIAALLRVGKFYVQGQQGFRAFTPPPPSPIAIGDEAHQRNLRKGEYVTACINAEGFRRSRLTLKPIIQAVAHSRGESPPGFSTVLSWIDEWARYGEYFGTAAYSDRHDLKGKSGSRLQPYQDAAVEVGIDYWLRLGTKKLGYDAVCNHVAKYDAEHGHELDKLQLPKGCVDRFGRLQPPSLRTFERRAAQLNRFEQDWALKGPAYAKQKNKTWQLTRLPERPYEVVEVDHHYIDVPVIDPDGATLGRPDLICFRDRATGMILGVSISFGEPSYAAFVEGLKHAMYPKDLNRYPGIKNPWPCFGRPETLAVDNGLAFIGSNIQAAANELGFSVTRLHPRQPWLKGALERFFGTLNTGLVHRLPGTVRHNVVVRNEHEHLGEPAFTLEEFTGLVTRWICDVYHQEVSKGLGTPRGVGARPIDIWNEKVASFKTLPIPHEEVFIRLVGDTDERTIQRDGIVWDHIKYEGPELWSLTTHPRHKRRSTDGTSTRYKTVRDPYNLGCIYVVDPYENRVLTVPATEGHRSYASGLTLHQHRVHIQRATACKNGAALDVDDLRLARSEIASAYLALKQNPSRKKVHREAVRYLEGEEARRRRLEPSIAQVVPSAASRLDWNAQLAAQSQTITPIEADPVEDWEEEVDLDDLAKKKGFETTYDRTR